MAKQVKSRKRKVEFYFLTKRLARLKYLSHPKRTKCIKHIKIYAANQDAIPRD
mgnify:CR=1 FL=1